jgi:hypothetical protein
VTYVVTANGFHSNDTVTVVIAVGVGTANLALSLVDRCGYLSLLYQKY